MKTFTIKNPRSTEWETAAQTDLRLMPQGASTLIGVAFLVSCIAYAQATNSFVGVMLACLFGVLLSYMVGQKLEHFKNLIYIGLGVFVATSFVLSPGLPLNSLMVLISHWMTSTLRGIKYKQDGAKALPAILMTAAIAISQSEDVFSSLMLIGSITICFMAMSWSSQEGDEDNSLKNSFKSVVWVIFLVAPIAVAMFLLLPRLPFGFNQMQGGEKSKATTGLSDSMSPGSVSDLVRSKKIAFTATFTKDVPPQNEQYWKANVLDRFDGISWSSTSENTTKGGNNIGLQTPIDYDYTIKLTPSMGLFMPILDTTDKNSLVIRNINNEGFPLTPSINGAYKNRVFEGLSILVTGKIGRTDEVNADLYPPRNIEVILPKNLNPKTHELAQRWAKEAQGQADPTSYVVNKFQKMVHDGSHRYTLNPPTWGKDGIDQFMFENPAGFCEHYASAFVFLMRAAGIPSRVVTGYQGSEVEGNVVRVLSQNAHAWAEVWYNGRGWVRVDPTSFVHPSRVELETQELISKKSGLMMKLASWSEMISGYWTDTIVLYDTERQANLLKNLLGERKDRPKNIALFLSFLLATFVAIKLARRARQRNLMTDDDRLLEAFDILLTKLKREGRLDSTAIHLNEVKDRLQSTTGYSNANEILRWLKEYERLRYAPHDPERSKRTHELVRCTPNPKSSGVV